MPPAFAVLTADLLLVIIDELLVILGQSGTHPGWPFFFTRLAAGNQASGVVSLCKASRFFIALNASVFIAMQSRPIKNAAGLLIATSR